MFHQGLQLACIVTSSDHHASRKCLGGKALVHLPNALNRLFLASFLKDRLIASLLACIVLLKLLDVTADAGLGVPIWHLVQEWTLLLLSAAGFQYLRQDRAGGPARHLRLVSGGLPDGGYPTDLA